MNFEELNKAVNEWAKNKGIHNKSDAYLQFDKTLEEVIELKHEVFLHQAKDCHASIDKIKSETGDVLVTLINMAHFLEIDLTECLEVAYNKINKRTGQMVAGKFVKD